MEGAVLTERPRPIRAADLANPATVQICGRDLARRHGLVAAGDQEEREGETGACTHRHVCTEHRAHVDDESRPRCWEPSGTLADLRER